ncbi:MAG: type II secretion system protein [Planctomycetaceae bacterium]|nr:type II secretion system protein [Planctomycetaceae bacterium]
MQTLHANSSTPAISRPRSARSGVTLLEAVMAMTILTITGSALLSAAMATIQSSSIMSQAVVAEGIADQLADEIQAIGFPRGTNTLPSAGTPRVAFNHVDDFAGYNQKPPVDRLNKTLGTEDPFVSTRNAALQPESGFISKFRQQVVVERLSPNLNSFDVVTSDTNYRRITVTVSYQDAAGTEIPLVNRTRILTRVEFTP